MSVTSVKTGTGGISLALNNNYMEPIATTLVGSGGVNIITFNNIPQTYKHLQLRAIYKDVNNAGYSLAVRFNNDFGTNYSYHYVTGNGSAVSASSAASNTNMALGNTWGTSAGGFGAGIFDILDYTSTIKNKTIKSLTGADRNGTGSVFFSSGAWYNTSAITTITLNNDVNFDQYSRFSLYGIKG